MRILCVDDEPLMLKMLEMAIRDAKPDADITAHKKQADLLEDARKNGCDIAFLDIHMRGMNGVERAKALKEVNPKMNIIFVTGYSEYAGEAMSLHASGYIMKPVTKEKIKQELEDLRFPIVPKMRFCECSASKISMYFFRTAAICISSGSGPRKCLRIWYTGREVPARQERSPRHSLRMSPSTRNSRIMSSS